MQNEEYYRLVRRMNDVQPSDRSAILVVMDCGGDIKTSTFGEPDAVKELRQRVLIQHDSFEKGGAR